VFELFNDRIDMLVNSHILRKSIGHTVMKAARCWPDRVYRAAVALIKEQAVASLGPGRPRTSASSEILTNTLQFQLPHPRFVAALGEPATPTIAFHNALTQTTVSSDGRGQALVDAIERGKMDC